MTVEPNPAEIALAREIVLMINGYVVPAWLRDDMADAIAKALAERREACAKWHSDTAEFLRRRAQQTREEWCTPDIPEDSRRENFRDARNDEATAAHHDRSAAAIRSMKS